MNTLTLPKLLGRFWRSLFHADKPSASGDLESSIDPYEKYKERIPNSASRRALEQMRTGEGTTTYEDFEDFRKAMDSL